MVGPLRACHDDVTMSTHPAQPLPDFRRAYRDTTSPMIGGVDVGVLHEVVAALYRVGFLDVIA